MRTAEANPVMQVKGGGHAMNPNFSSSTGVQIAMSRFNKVVYNAASKTVDVGSGLIWDDVYAALHQGKNTLLRSQCSRSTLRSFVDKLSLT